ncbi:unnamed protein product [Fusarium graminearum]|uniref:Chromosome 1, complete genome n=2 Tax=Gibberella zeae TaxID=5518 RepID=A0A098D610_GIBZE|nr:hypothetical protein HG531_012442 [Fusarium graminearum]CAF3590335.1 unnamed protein product [Fusarium graminearum]CAF3603627.1 unnamed protein product [Fusarium graminearum]CAG1969335.1 unnamed protein product [Fusarium graminearum]CAG1970673.1 unnamed protein product [Fusarium graminearum]
MVQKLNDFVAHGLEAILGDMVGFAGLAIAEHVKRNNSIPLGREMANLMEPVVEGGWEAVEEEEGCGAGCGFDGDEGVRVAAVGCECIT